MNEILYRKREEVFDVCGVAVVSNEHFRLELLTIDKEKLREIASEHMIENADLWVDWDDQVILLTHTDIDTLADIYALTDGFERNADFIPEPIGKDYVEGTLEENYNFQKRVTEFKKHKMLKGLDS